MIGLVGKKIGMTRIFTKEGNSIPVTVIQVQEQRVTQIKNFKKDGYLAIQVTTGNKKSKHINKAQLGHFAKFGIKPGNGLWEFKLNLQELKYSVGDIIDTTFLNNIKKVDITGMSKGKGFSGTIKRWNFSSQDATHGNSLSHRVPGSIGQNQSPGKVFKGKKMAGQLGNEQITIQSLEIIRIDNKRNLILVKGSVPGTLGSNLIVRPAVKC